MLLQPQLSNRELTALCHRLGVETDAGIDIRRTWQREANSAPRRFRHQFSRIRDAIDRGDSLTTALLQTGRIFPPLFLEMAHVGEETGTLGRVFHHLSTHYRRQVDAQRIFVRAITWPMMELAMAVLVIGALIWVLGILADRGGRPIDILGFGLIGTRGLIIYAAIVSAIVLGVAAVVVAVRRGMLWTRPLQHAMLRLPAIGPALEKIYLARLAWAMHLTLNVAMDYRRLIPLVLRTTGNEYYIRQTDRITRIVTAGQPLHSAFAATGAFPADFLDALAVAEESGELVESMNRLSKRYEEEAESAVHTLANVFGFFVAAMVMAIIAFMIFRIAAFYLGSINEALDMAR